MPSVDDVRSVDAVPPVSAIADVLALWGRDGWLTPPLRPVVAAANPILALVRTVSLCAGDASGASSGLTDLYALLDTDLSGCAVVISARADGQTVDGAVWGEILATTACRSGAVTVLVDGAVRDVDDLSELALPTYSADQQVVGPNGTAHVRCVDGAVHIGSVEVSPADHVVVDSSGCVRLTGDVGGVLDAAAHYAAAETKVLEALAGGVPLGEAYRLKKAAVAELRR